MSFCGHEKYRRALNSFFTSIDWHVEVSRWCFLMCDIGACALLLAIYSAAISHISSRSYYEEGNPNRSHTIIITAPRRKTRPFARNEKVLRRHIVFNANHSTQKRARVQLRIYVWKPTELGLCAISGMPSIQFSRFFCPWTLSVVIVFFPCANFK